jgi:hypothetical protein
MAQNDNNRVHWTAYILGLFTGIPTLIRGVRHDDRTEAFHGAQATAWGLLFTAGLVLLVFALQAALPYMGVEGSLKSMYISVAVWLGAYFWLGYGLWLYLACIVTARSGGWNVSPVLTKLALGLENCTVFLFRK